MNEVKRQCKVVMLPANEKTNILVNTYIKDTHKGVNRILSKNNRQTLQFNSTVEQLEARGYKHQHLYIISDDKIEKGDRFINLIQAVEKDYHEFGNGLYQHNLDNYTIKDYHKKVIATTNSNITKKVIDKYNKGFLIDIPALPRPSDDFIKAYVKAGGIDEVTVDYIYEGSFFLNKGSFIVKTAPDNTITISKIKNTWTKEELLNFFNTRISNINTEIKHTDDNDQINYLYATINIIRGIRKEFE